MPKHSMRHFLMLVIAAAILSLSLAAPVEAIGNAQMVPYVVQPNDTLSAIAARHCTTPQHLYAINRNIIGPNPNVLKSGTVIWVPTAQCGGPSPSSTPPSGCPSGPIPHAMGPVSGNVYTVVAGDTLFSIARRFCTTTQQLAAANHIPNPYLIFVGQSLIVPAGTSPTPGPTPRPSPTASPTTQRYLSITVPAPGSVIVSPFTVSGNGAGLFEGNVVVTVLAQNGQQLAQQVTTLQGPNVGAGGPGTWSVTMTVNVAPGTPGTIQATSPQSNVPPSVVNVIFGGAPPPSFKTFAPGECQVQGRPNAPLFAFPNGPQAGQFPPAGGVFNALAGARVDNQFWYQIVAVPSTPAVWAPVNSLITTIGNCIW